ncbi:hypothetical protein Tco_1284545 [Tanacetum coccineum]
MSGAKAGTKKKHSKHNLGSKEDATKSQPSSKEVAHSPTGHSKKKKKFDMAKDKALRQSSVSTPVDTELDKEDLQAAGNPTILRVASEEGAHPQLSSGCDASAYSTAEVDPEKSAPNDSIPHQQGMDEGTKHYTPGLIFAGTNLTVLVDQTTSAEDGLKIAHTNLDTRSAFFTLDSLQDKPIIVSDESKEVKTEKDKDTYATSYDVPEDTSVPHPPPPKSAQIQELMAQVYLFQSQMDTLEQQKEKAKAEVASLKAMPSYPDINKLTKLLVISLKPKLSKLLASHDFSSSISSELKELPSKITTLAGEIQELKMHV